VVLVPESGDGIQVMKAGLMEIADVLVVNKADRPGAQSLAGEIGAMLDLKDWSGWRPPVLQAQARDGQGIDQVLQALDAHRAWLVQHGELQRKQRRALESRVRDLVDATLAHEVWESDAARRRLHDGLDAMGRGAETPYRLAEAIVEESRRRFAEKSSSPKG
jgi:LAO/AO transport system kinase